MKIGDVIAINKESNHRQIIDIERGILVNTFVLQNILRPSEIIRLDGDIIRDEWFREKSREEVELFIDTTENWFPQCGYEITWDKEEVLNRLYGESR